MELALRNPELERKIMACSLVEAALVETLVLAQKSLVCLLMMTGPVLKDLTESSGLLPIIDSFPLSELRKIAKAGPENKDGSDTEDDDDDDDAVEEQDDDDDDAGDEDYSGEEGGDDDDEADPEDDGEANGKGGAGSDDEDDDDDDDEDEDGEDEDDEDEDGEDEEEEDQPPAKKRK